MLSALGSQAQVDSTKELSEVVVTANRFPQKQNNTGKVMTIITKQEIQRAAYSNLAELLGRQVGIAIVGANNAPGTNNDVYMRGAGTGNTLILIDGYAAMDASTIRSTFDLNFISLDAIERIEILKGGHSTLYGSDAVAGVINIITQKNETRKSATQVHLSNGSFGTNTMDLGTSGTTKLLKYSIQYHNTSSAGFSSAADTSGKGDFDKDRFDQQQFAAQLGSSGKSSWSWNAGTNWSRYKNDLDETRFTDADDFRVTNENLHLRAGISKKWAKGNIHANYSLNNSIRNYLDDSLDITGFARFIRSDYKGRTSVAEVYGDVQLTENIRLLSGIEHRWQNTDQYYLSLSNFGKYETTLADDSARINITSFMASAVYNGKNGFNLESGVRYNIHSMYGHNVTYTFNPSYLVSEKIKLAFNLYSAFKAPTLYQLYDGFSGQRNLKPETSITSEFSIQLLGIKYISARATAFSRRILNGIDYDYANYKYFNNNKQNDKGLELEAAYNNTEFQLSANYTYVHGRVNTAKFVYDPTTWSYKQKGDTTFSHLNRIPAHSINLSAGWNATDRLYVSIIQRFVGKRYEPIFGGKPIQMDPFNTTDLNAQYRWSKKIRVYGAIKNLFNTRYQEVLGYNTRLRNYVLGLRLSL